MLGLAAAAAAAAAAVAAVHLALLHGLPATAPRPPDAGAHSSPPDCRAGALPVVRSLAAISQSSYGRPGLAHMTVLGAVHHGSREVEIWLQAFAPGPLSATPIHRHDCEEVFVTMGGAGTLYMAHGGLQSPSPGKPAHYEIFANSTFTIPPNFVHQVVNTGPELLQLLVIISRPPIRIYTYSTWDDLHQAAALQFPYTWDRVLIVFPSYELAIIKGFNLEPLLHPGFCCLRKKQVKLHLYIDGEQSSTDIARHQALSAASLAGGLATHEIGS
eukprot:SM000080S22954  [mRNA]  locus=s80:303506:305420:- [translate_table: standard]